MVIERDFLVIGAGSGGLTISTGLHKFNKSFALVSKNIGGECTNSGCIPSKTLLKLGRQNLPHTNIFTKVQKQIDETLEEEERFINKIDFFLGEAKFINKNSVKVSLFKSAKYNKKRKDSITIKFKKCVIATGSSALQGQQIPGLEELNILTNENIFQLTKIPKRLYIIGGGPIAAEMATAFANLGTEVKIFVRSKFLKNEPSFLVKHIKYQLKKNRVEFLENTEIVKVQAQKLLDSNDTLHELPDHVLLALGRTPNTNLDLEKADVQYTNQKGIIVNKNLKTTNKNIYAVGDCTNSPKYTHLADSHARFVFIKFFIPFLNRRNVATPRVIFTEPPIASVGTTQETDFIKAFKLNFTKTDKAKIDGKQISHGVIYIHMLTGKIKGASIVGDFAEHIINFFTLAINEKVSAFKLNSFMAPYPTYFSNFNSIFHLFLKRFITNLKPNLILLIKQNIFRILSFILWLITFILLITLLAQNNFNLQNILTSFDDIFRAEYGFLIFILIYCLRPFLVVFSATILSVLVGFYYGFWEGLLIVIVASNLSSVVAYYIGKILFASKATTEKQTRNLLTGEPFFAVLTARLTFLPYDLVSFIAGYMKLPIHKFVLASAIGSLPGSIAIVSFGASLENLENTGNFSLDPIYMIISILALAGAFILKYIFQKLSRKY